MGLVLGVNLLAPRPGSAFHTIYDFAFDRVEIDGNASGSFDGTPDFVNEFTSGDPEVDTTVFFGTRTESGGLLHLTNPGDHVPYPESTVELDQSMVVLKDVDGLPPGGIQNGSGDATIRAVLQQTTLDVDMAVAAFVMSSTASEGFFVALTNFGSEIADRTGLPQGYTMGTAYACCSSGGGNSNQWSGVTSFDPDAITGDVIFQIAFDDTADTVTGSVSLDGGATFQTFASHPYFQASTQARIGLYADPYLPVPTTTTTLPPSATNIGVAPVKLIAVDKLTLASKAKMTFVAKDAAVTKGSGTTPGDISARFTVKYVDGAANGSFTLPQGFLWLTNSTSVAKFVNKEAPGGPTEAKVSVIKTGSLVKLVGKGLGDTPFDIFAAGPPLGDVYTAYCVTNAGEETCLCSRLSGCVHKLIAGDTGAKLVCKGGMADPACTAAVPPSTTSTTLATTTTISTSTSTSSTTSTTFQ